jgi:hypothetical protein
VDSISPVIIADIESTLCQVGEIKAARVVTGVSGTIREVHVLALPTKAPKQLVRDIESTIMASFGIPIDHKVISIAQLGPEMIPRNPAQDRARAKIDSINTEAVGVEATVSVTLEIEGDKFMGRASGPGSQTARQRLVALATLNAVEQYVAGPQAFALEDVHIVTLGQEQVAVCCVVLVTPLGEQSFAGSALMRHNEKDSIVRATLDAINRRLGFLTTA